MLATYIHGMDGWVDVRKGPWALPEGWIGLGNGGDSLVVQWLGAFTARGPGSIPGPGTEIPTSCVVGIFFF